MAVVSRAAVNLGHNLVAASSRLTVQTTRISQLMPLRISQVNRLLVKVIRSTTCRVRPAGKVMLGAGLWSMLKWGSEETQKMTTDEEKLVHLIKLGVKAVQDGETKKAEQLLHLALRTAQEIQSSDGITYIYDLLANIAYEEGNVVKAERLFLDVMRRLFDSGKANDCNEVVHISLKLASMYAQSGDFVKADEGFRFCVETQQKKVDQGVRDEDTMNLWALSMDSFAHYLLGRRKIEEARTYFQKAYDVCKSVRGDTDEQTLILLGDLGGVSSMLGKYEEAQDLYQEAIKLGKESECTVLGSLYVNSGVVYVHQRRMKDAEDACTEARRLGRLRNDKEVEKEAADCLQEIKKILLATHK